MQDLSLYVGKAISIKLVDTSVRTGYLYAVDPGNGTVVLLIQNSASETDKATFRVCVVFPSAVAEFSETEVVPFTFEHAVATCALLGKGEQRAHDPPEKLNRRRQALENVLEQRRIPFSLDGDTIVAMGGLVRIQPPYLQDNCSSSNAVVLDRVMGVLFG